MMTSRASQELICCYVNKKRVLMSDKWYCSQLWKMLLKMSTSESREAPKLEIK